MYFHGIVDVCDRQLGRGSTLQRGAWSTRGQGTLGPWGCGRHTTCGKRTSGSSLSTTAISRPDCSAHCTTSRMTTSSEHARCSDLSRSFHLRRWSQPARERGLSVRATGRETAGQELVRLHQRPGPGWREEEPAARRTIRHRGCAALTARGRRFEAARHDGCDEVEGQAHSRLVLWVLTVHTCKLLGPSFSVRRATQRRPGGPARGRPGCQAGLPSRGAATRRACVFPACGVSCRAGCSSAIWSNSAVRRAARPRLYAGGPSRSPRLRSLKATRGVWSGLCLPFTVSLAVTAARRPSAVSTSSAGASTA